MPVGWMGHGQSGGGNPPVLQRKALSEGLHCLLSDAYAAMHHARLEWVDVIQLAGCQAQPIEWREFLHPGGDGSVHTACVGLATVAVHLECWIKLSCVLVATKSPPPPEPPCASSPGPQPDRVVLRRWALGSSGCVRAMSVFSM
jgi:hypothetical protein